MPLAQAINPTSSSLIQKKKKLCLCYIFNIIGITQIYNFEHLPLVQITALP